MSRKFLTPIRFLVRETDPSSGVLGDTYFNSTDKSIRMFNGNVWVTIIKSDDPTPFYMHTHTYDGDVHTIHVDNIVNVEDMSHQSGALEELPVIISYDGGNPGTEATETTPFNLNLDGETIIGN